MQNGTGEQKELKGKGKEGGKDNSCIQLIDICQQFTGFCSSLIDKIMEGNFTALAPRSADSDTWHNDWHYARELKTASQPRAPNVASRSQKAGGAMDNSCSHTIQQPFVSMQLWG